MRHSTTGFSSYSPPPLKAPPPPFDFSSWIPREIIPPFGLKKTLAPIAFPPGPFPPPLDPVLNSGRVMRPKLDSPPLAFSNLFTPSRGIPPLCFGIFSSKLPPLQRFPQDPLSGAITCGLLFFRSSSYISFFPCRTSPQTYLSGISFKYDRGSNSRIGSVFGFLLSPQLRPLFPPSELFFFSLEPHRVTHFST